MTVRVALLPLARTTFDMALAEETLARMLAALDGLDVEIVGLRRLLTDGDANRSALAECRKAAPDRLLVLQVTFTDAAFVADAAQTLGCPVSLWAPREARTGGRLRLNAFCGLNLAAHALGLRDVPFSALYEDPDAPELSEKLTALLSGESVATAPAARPSSAPPLEDSPLKGRCIVRIGDAPEGFDTCRYDAADVANRFGARVEALPLDRLFATAKTVPPADLSPLRTSVAAAIDGLDALDPGEVDRSLRLKLALERLLAAREADAFAVRCWPETFTEYGGAVCAPLAMMGEARVPCACEADLWGALTQLALQSVAASPVFLVDLVDIDPADDSAVVWHCGQAPPSMAADRPSATVHTNRRQALLYAFALKPGRVTFLRLSQARGTPVVVIASGTMLDRPAPFTGTSGTVRFDAPAGTVMERILGLALEHHTALAYGDHRDALLSLAATLGLPVVDLTAADERRRAA